MIVQSRCQFHTRREGRPTSSPANMAPSFDDRYWPFSSVPEETRDFRY